MTEADLQTRTERLLATYACLRRGSAMNRADVVEYYHRFWRYQAEDAIAAARAAHPHDGPQETFHRLFTRAVDTLMH